MLHHVIMKNIKTIDIKGTLFSGQSFLWSKILIPDNYFATIIDRKAVIIRQLSDNTIEVYSSSSLVNGMELPEFIDHYFTLDINTENVFPENFSWLYPELWALLTGYFSLRILRQDPFETMITFMCAQGIGMHLIRKQVTMLAERYGEKRVIPFSGSKIMLHSFPSPQQLAAADPLLLSACTNNNRLRAMNIIRASREVAEGRLDLEALQKSSITLAELRNTLCQRSGIGFKIADCIALFGLGRFDAFPIDTHVRQYLKEWFNCTTPFRSLSPAAYLMLDSGARKLLNPDLAGYGGHILFHCWRKEIKKLRSF